MYRAFALKALAAGVATGDAAALDALAHATQVRLEPGLDGNRVLGNRVLLDGVDVTEQLRTPQITAAASEVSVHPPIRRWLVRLQQALGAQGNVVMEGRDIGTVVFPHAPVKIFLDASPEKRGERRYEQNRAGDEDVQQTGTTAVATQLPTKVLEEIRERDRRDRTRADSPLRPAARRHHRRLHRPHARTGDRASRRIGGSVFTIFQPLALSAGLINETVV